VTIFGIDYAWGRPGPAALQHAGVKFVARYLSHDSGKNLSRAEAELLSDSGISIVVVWETTASRALSGKAGGVADAKDADRQAKACGMPGGRPIYFAVDWDASTSQQAAINAYLDGAASVLGRDRVGLYAGYGPISRAFSAKKISYGWQTYAWSGGRWDSRAQLQQYSNGHTLNGVGVDYNHAVKADYGQWRVGVSPTTNEGEDPNDMTPDTIVKVPSYWADKSRSHFSHPTYSVAFLMAGTLNEVRSYGARIEAKLAAQQTLINTLAKTLGDVVANTKGLDSKAIVDAINGSVAAVKDEIGKLDVQVVVGDAAEPSA
jgi:hypothetical protein